MTEICAMCNEDAMYRLELKTYHHLNHSSGTEIEADYCPKHYLKRLTEILKNLREWSKMMSE